MTGPMAGIMKIFYVDHTWQQRDDWWEWECTKCGERCRTRTTVRGGFIYAVREPGDARAQRCVVIEQEWRD